MSSRVSWEPTQLGCENKKSRNSSWFSSNALNINSLKPRKETLGGCERTAGRNIFCTSFSKRRNAERIRAKLRRCKICESLQYDISAPKPLWMKINAKISISVQNYETEERDLQCLTMHSPRERPTSLFRQLFDLLAVLLGICTKISLILIKNEAGRKLHNFFFIYMNTCMSAINASN